MKAALTFALVLVAVYPRPASAQDTTRMLVSPYFSEARSTTDLVWLISKPLSFAAAHADAYSTARAIERGYVERNPLDNLLIARNSPAAVSRSALLHGETFAINLLLDFAYGKCGTSKLCKWSVIGARSYFTGRSVASTIHNIRLP